MSGMNQKPWGPIRAPFNKLCGKSGCKNISAGEAYAGEERLILCENHLKSLPPSVQVTVRWHTIGESTWEVIEIWSKRRWRVTATPASEEWEEIRKDASDAVKIKLHFGRGDFETSSDVLLPNDQPVSSSKTLLTPDENYVISQPRDSTIEPETRHLHIRKPDISQYHPWVHYAGETSAFGEIEHLNFAARDRYVVFQHHSGGGIIDTLTGILEAGPHHVLPKKTLWIDREEGVYGVIEAKENLLVERLVYIESVDPDQVIAVTNTLDLLVESIDRPFGQRFTLFREGYTSSSAKDPFHSKKMRHLNWVHQRGFLFSDDRRYCVQRGDKLKLWDVKTGQLLAHAPDISVRAVCFSPKVDRLVASTTNSVTIWKLPEGHQLLDLSAKQSAFVRFTADGLKVHFTDGNNFVTYDIDNQKELNRVKLPLVRHLKSIDLSRNERLLAFGDFATVILFDLFTKEILYKCCHVCGFLNTFSDMRGGYLVMLPDGRFKAPEITRAKIEVRLGSGEESYSINDYWQAFPEEARRLDPWRHDPDRNVIDPDILA